MNKKALSLQPVEMTPQVMQELEDKGLIIRLAPNRHELPVGPGQTLDGTLYASSPQYGSHKLISVTVNRVSFANFGSHPDNEEFLFIGDPATKAMHLVIALCLKDELNAKLNNGTVTPADFVCLHVKYNDPEVSFFTMLKDVPHGEAVAPGTGRPPTFYVTEPTDMGIERTPFGTYELSVVE